MTPNTSTAPLAATTTRATAVPLWRGLAPLCAIVFLEFLLGLVIGADGYDDAFAVGALAAGASLVVAVVVWARAPRSSP